MDQSTKRALIIGSTAVAGGAGGSWLTAKLGTTFGFRFGPWGVVAGALIGALAGAALSRGAAEPQALEYDEE